MPSYRVLTGIDYPPGRRAEADDVVDDSPGKSIKWLVEAGVIEKVEGKPSKAPKAPKVDPVVEEPMVEEPVVEETYSWTDATKDEEADA